MATSDSTPSSTEASTTDEAREDTDATPPIQRGVRRVARARRDADHHNTIELAPPFRFSC